MIFSSVWLGQGGLVIAVLLEALWKVFPAEMCVREGRSVTCVSSLLGHSNISCNEK